MVYSTLPLPLGVWEGLRFVIVALPGLFPYLLFVCLIICLSQTSPLQRETSLPQIGKETISISQSSRSSYIQQIKVLINLVGLDTLGGLFAIFTSPVCFPAKIPLLKGDWHRQRIVGSQEDPCSERRWTSFDNAVFPCGISICLNLTILWHISMSKMLAVFKCLHIC